MYPEKGKMPDDVRRTSNDVLAFSTVSGKTWPVLTLENASAANTGIKFFSSIQEVYEVW